MLFNIAWDLADVVFCSLLDKPESANDHWDSCCFHFPRFLNFNIKIFVLGEFFHYIQGSVPFCGERYIDKKTGSFLLVFHHYVLCVCFYLFVGLDWHVPKYSRCLVFCHSNWFMSVVFILYFDVIVFAYCPVEIYCMYSILASSGHSETRPSTVS